MTDAVFRRDTPVVAQRARVSARTILLARLDSFGLETPTSIQDENRPDPDLARTLRERSDALRGELLSGADVGVAASLAATDPWMIVGDTRPKDSSRKINSHRAPDELAVTLPWTQLPLDPRILRSVLLLHYEGTVSSEDYARGMRGGGSVVRATADNLRFVGFADESESAHGEGDELKFQARDLTALLIDQKIPLLLPDSGVVDKRTLPQGQKRIRSGTSIPDVIRNLLNIYPQFAMIRGPFVRLEEGDELPELDPSRYARLAIPPSELHRVKRPRGFVGPPAPTPYVLRNSAKPGEESFWDAITDLCVSHGLIAMIDRFDLVIMRPRTLYRADPIHYATSQRRFPVVGGHRERLGDTDPVRRMVFGRNVEGLRFRRKLARIKAPNIRVTSYDPDATDSSRRLLTATWPPPNQVTRAATSIQAGSGAGAIEYVNHVVHGVRSQAILESVAEAIWDSIARQELSASFTTHDVASWSDDPRFEAELEPDVLALRAGDPIKLFIAPADRRAGGDAASISELGLMVRRMVGGAGEQSAAAYLVGLGFRPQDAQKILRVMRSSDLLDVFRVANATVTFGVETGFATNIEVRSYVRARAPAPRVETLPTLSTVRLPEV